jgi:hypothetical protein
VVVSSGRGMSGSVFIIGVWGGVMVNSSVVQCGVYYHIHTSSMSGVAAAAYHKCINPWVGDVSHHFCGSYQHVVGDCGSVLSYSLFGEHFLFPMGLHTMSRMSSMPYCTLYS